MHKLRTVGATLFIAGALAVPLLTSAQSVTTLEQQLQTLLAELTALQQSGATTVPAAQPQQAVPNSTAAANIICPSLVRTLALGSSGTDVANLQGFLAQNPLIYPEGTVTGYFGMLTQDAVQRWQSAYGVVSSGSPASTGYGLVGARTRAAITASCVNHSGTSSVISSPSSMTTPAGSQQPLCPIAPQPATPCPGTWSPLTNATGCTIAWQCALPLPGYATSSAATQATTTAATSSASSVCATYTLPLCQGGSQQWLGTDSKGCNLGYQCIHPGAAQ